MSEDRKPSGVKNITIMNVFKKSMSSNITLLCLSGLIFIIGFSMSIYNNNFQWLSRFCSLIICLGIIALARYSISGMPLRTDCIMAETGLSDLDPKHYEQTREALPDWLCAELQAQRAVGIYGPILCLVGTIGNGFADLLTKIS